MPGLRRLAHVALLAGVCVPMIAACGSATAPGTSTRTAGPDSRSTTSASAVGEQAVIVHFANPGTTHPTTAPDEDLSTLEDQLDRAISRRGVGELDGNEFGPDEILLYAYGPSAKALFDVMAPLLRTFPARPAYAELRFGPDAAARTERVDL